MKTGLNYFFDKLFGDSNTTVTPEPKGKVEYTLIGESLIPKLDGQQVIFQQAPIFKVGISEEFKKYCSDKNKKATPETLLACYEIRSMGKQGVNLRNLPGTWSKKCVTQHQVIKFCLKSKKFLATAYDASTIFLCKMDENKPINEIRPYDNLMAVHVWTHDRDLHIVYAPLHFSDTIGESYFYRIVMPKI
jgi:hypothetical protein